MVDEELREDCAGGRWRSRHRPDGSLRVREL